MKSTDFNQRGDTSGYAVARARRAGIPFAKMSEYVKPANDLNGFGDSPNGEIVLSGHADPDSYGYNIDGVVKDIRTPEDFVQLLLPAIEKMNSKRVALKKIILQGCEAGAIDKKLKNAIGDRVVQAVQLIQRRYPATMVAGDFEVLASTHLNYTILLGPAEGTFFASKFTKEDFYQNTLGLTVRNPFFNEELGLPIRTNSLGAGRGIRRFTFR